MGAGCDTLLPAAGFQQPGSPLAGVDGFRAWRWARAVCGAGLWESAVDCQTIVENWSVLTHTRFGTFTDLSVI